MLQIIQEHPRYGLVPAFPEFYDFNSANFDLIPTEVKNGIRKRCCLRVKIIPDGDCLQIRFTRNNMLRTWLEGQMDVEDLDESAFKQMAELIVEQILPQIGKAIDDDIVVLVDVS